MSLVVYLSSDVPKLSRGIIVVICLRVNLLEDIKLIMPYQAIEKALSVSRLSTYRNSVHAVLGEGCLETSLELYEWNADLSANFLVAIHIYEVALRNAISDAITFRYGSDWPINIAFQNSLPRWLKNELIGLDEVKNYQSVGKVLPELRPVWYKICFALLMIFVFGFHIANMYSLML